MVVYYHDARETQRRKEKEKQKEKEGQSCNERGGETDEQEMEIDVHEGHV